MDTSKTPPVLTVKEPLNVLVFPQLPADGQLIVPESLTAPVKVALDEPSVKVPPALTVRLPSIKSPAP